MVETDIKGRGVSDAGVLMALERVPRHLFVPGAPPSDAYADRPLPIGGGQTISQPYIVARMAELAAVKPNDRALEVGAGCGYGAAVLAEISDRVVAVEVRPELAASARRRLADLGYENVEVVTGDGVEVAVNRGPFDVISVPAAASAIPLALEASLAAGGRLVIPVGGRQRQHLWVVTRGQDGEFDRRRLEPVAFVPLVEND